MIQVRLVGTQKEIEETIKTLSIIYEVHHNGIRKGRKGREYLCYINALIPKQIESIEALKGEIKDLKEQLQNALAPKDAAIISEKSKEQFPPIKTNNYKET